MMASPGQKEVLGAILWPCSMAMKNWHAAERWELVRRLAFLIKYARCVTTLLMLKRMCLLPVPIRYAKKVRTRKLGF